MAVGLGVALLVGNFVLIMDGLLMAILLHLLFTFRATRVVVTAIMRIICSFSFTLAMAALTMVGLANLMANSMGVVSNNVGGLEDICVLVMTVLGDDVFTLLDHCGGDNNIVFLMTNLLVVTLLLMDNVI